MTMYKVEDTDLTTVADAIRSKGGTSASLAFPTGFSTAIGNIKTLPATITAGNTPVAMTASVVRTATSSLTASSLTITVPKAGTWRIKWMAVRTNTSSSYTWGTQAYKGSTAIGSLNTTWTNSYNQANSVDVACNKNDTITIYTQGRGGSYYVCVGFLTLCCNATLI